MIDEYLGFTIRKRDGKRYFTGAFTYLELGFFEEYKIFSKLHKNSHHERSNS